MREQSEIIAAVKKVMPAVVSIVVSKKLERVEKEIKKNFPAHQRNTVASVPPEKIDAHGMVQVGGGSGSIVNKKGIILTNKHVVSEPFAEYTVITNDGLKYPTEILARDPIDDIAILKINPENHNFPTVKLGDSEKVELGEYVLAFGNALGIIVFRAIFGFGVDNIKKQK